MKKAAEKPKSQLLSALRHVSVCQRDTGNERQTHCSFAKGFLTAYDGQLAAGVMVQEELNLRPHTLKLLESLERCEETISLTQTEHRLRVTSGPFRALIPCTPNELQQPFPDPVKGTLGAGVREALSIAGSLASETAGKLLHATELLQPRTATGTNSIVVIEAWHGYDLPCDFVLHKGFVAALEKINKLPTHFGYTPASFTVYFEDKSWLRTQLVADKWPDVGKLLNIESLPKRLNPKFFKAAEIVSSVGKDTDIVYGGNSCADAAYNTLYDLPLADLPELHFDSSQLALISKYATHADFFAMKGRGMLFFGDTVRGAVCYKS